MCKDFCLRWIEIDVSAAAKQLKAGFCFNATEIFSIQTGEMRDALGIKTFMGFLHDIRMSFVQERVETGCYIITSVIFIRNESFLSEFIGVFFTERNTHSGRSFLPVQCKRGTALTFVWILCGSEGSIEKDRKGHKHLFLQANNFIAVVFEILGAHPRPLM